jgi:hypothetical protein
MNASRDLDSNPAIIAQHLILMLKEQKDLYQMSQSGKSSVTKLFNKVTKSSDAQQKIKFFDEQIRALEKSIERISSPDVKQNKYAKPEDILQKSIQACITHLLHEFEKQLITTSKGSDVAYAKTTGSGAVEQDPTTILNTESIRRLIINSVNTPKKHIYTKGIATILKNLSELSAVNQQLVVTDPRQPPYKLYFDQIFQDASRHSAEFEKAKPQDNKPYSSSPSPTGRHD